MTHLPLVALEGEHGGEGDGVVDHDGVLHCGNQEVAAVAGGQMGVVLPMDYLVSHLLD